MKTKKARIVLLPFDYVELLAGLTKFQQDGYELMEVKKTHFSFEQTQKKMNYRITFTKKEKDSWNFIGQYKDCMYIYKSTDCVSSKEDYAEMAESLSQTSYVKKSLFTYIALIAVMVAVVVLVILLDFKPLVRILLVIVAGITIVASLYLIRIIIAFQKKEVNKMTKSSYPLLCLDLAAIVAAFALIAYFDFSVLIIVLVVTLGLITFWLFHQ